MTNVTNLLTKKDAIDDGLGLKSGLILGPLIAIEIPFHREATNLSRPYQLTGSTPQEVGLPRRFTSRLRRSHRGHILGVPRMLSIRFFETPPNFFASEWHG